MFRVIDRASGPMQRMERQARQTDAAIESLGVTSDRVGSNQQQRQLAAMTGGYRDYGRQVDDTGTRVRRFDRDLNSHTSTWGRLRQQVTQTGVAIKAAGAIFGVLKLPVLAAGIGVLVQAVGALSGGIVALLPRLISLSGTAAALGPTLAGIGLAAVTVKLATSGLSQAWGGNAQALKALTPQARAFLVTMREYKPVLKELKASAQGGLFSGLDTAVPRLMRGLPTVNALLKGMSATLGGLAVQASNRFTTPGFLQDLLGIGQAGTSAVGRGGSAIINLVDGLRQLTAAAIPFTDWITKGVVQLSKYFDSWAQFERDSGRFAQFLDKTRTSLGLFGSILHNVLSWVTALGRAAEPLGNMLWRDVDKGTASWAKYANSVQGQVKITREFTDMYPAVHQMVTLFDDLVRAIFTMGTSQQLPNIVSTLDKLIPDFQNLLNLIVSSFGPPTIALLAQLTTTLTLLTGATGPITIMLTLFSNILGMINNLIGAIPGLNHVIAAAFSVVTIGLFVNKLQGVAAGWWSVVAGANAAATAQARALIVGGGAGAAGAVGTAERLTAGGVILPAGVGTGLGGAAAVGEGVAGASKLARLGSVGGRLGGAALDVAGKFALPITALLAAYGGISSQRSGGFLNQAAQVGAGALHAVDFGLTPLIQTPTMKADKQVSNLLNGYTQHIHGPNDNVSWTNALSMGLLGSDGSRAVQHRGLAQDLAMHGGDNPSTLNQVNAQLSIYQSFMSKLSAINTDTARAAVAQMQSQVTSLTAVQKRIMAMQNQASRATGAKNIRDLGGAYTTYAKAYGNSNALGRTNTLLSGDLQKLQGPGRREEAQDYLNWAMQEGKAGVFTPAQVNSVKNTITKTYKDLGTNVVIQNGKILDGTAGTWDKIQTAMKTKSERAAEQVSSAFTNMQQKARGSLLAMGFNWGAATSLVAALETGGAAAKRADAQIAAKTTPFGSNLFGNATGGRIQGGRGLYDSVGLGGGNVAANGELVVNRHTERKVNYMLGGQTTLGHMVGSETRPHYAATGGRLQLPANFTPTHQTAGLPGFPAIDNFAPGGTSVLSPVGGKLVDVHMIPWNQSERVGGITAYLQGQNGSTYFLTHMAGTVNAGNVKTGQVIGQVATVPHNWWASHIHEGKHQGIYNPGNVFSSPSISLAAAVAGSSVGGDGATGSNTQRAARKLKGVQGGLADQINLLFPGTPSTGASKTGTAVGSNAGGGNAFSTATGNRGLAQQMMLAAGYSAGQWPSLNALWTQESGFNAYAVNSKSGAMGIPQALGHGNVFRLGDAKAQIAWGLNYIGGRYGSPAAAEAHEKSVGWYKNGGDFIARKPMTIGVGDNPAGEHVTVTPLNKKSASGAMLQVHVEHLHYSGNGDAAKMLEREFEQLARMLENQGMVGDEEVGT